MISKWSLLRAPSSLSLDSWHNFVLSFVQLISWRETAAPCGERNLNRHNTWQPVCVTCEPTLSRGMELNFDVLVLNMRHPSFSFPDVLLLRKALLHFFAFVFDDREGPMCALAETQSRGCACVNERTSSSSTGISGKLISLMSCFKSVISFSNSSYLFCRVISLSYLPLQIHTHSSVSPHSGRLRPTSSLYVCWSRVDWVLFRPQPSHHETQAANFSSASLARNILLLSKDLNTSPRNLTRRKSWFFQRNHGSNSERGVLELVQGH